MAGETPPSVSWRPTGEEEKDAEDPKRVSTGTAEVRKEFNFLGGRKKKTSAIANLALRAIGVEPDAAGGQETERWVVRSLQEEVASTRAEENIVRLQRQFPRPREQIVHQQGLGDGGGDIFSSSAAGVPEGHDAAAQLEDSEGRKAAVQSLVRAVLAGEQGEVLARRLRKAGGPDILGLLTVEMKGKAEALASQMGTCVGKAAKVTLFYPCRYYNK
jgi:hypothetical protein